MPCSHCKVVFQAHWLANNVTLNYSLSCPLRWLQWSQCNVWWASVFFPTVLITLKSVAPNTLFQQCHSLHVYMYIYRRAVQYTHSPLLLPLNSFSHLSYAHCYHCLQKTGFGETQNAKKFSNLRFSGAKMRFSWSVFLSHFCVQSKLFHRDSRNACRRAVVPYKISEGNAAAGLSRSKHWDRCILAAT